MADSTGVTIYGAGNAPAELATRRQLRAEGLSVAGLRPAAQLEYARYYQGWHICPLYRRTEARPVRPLTPAQAAALAEGRKLAGTRPCRRCHTVRVPVWDGKYCDGCRAERAAAAAARRERRLADDRAAAVRWAAEVLADPATVYLDTETTGLGPDDYIVEIAILDGQGNPLVDTLMNPQVDIPHQAARIHGITDEAVSDAPVFADLWPQIRQAIEGKRLVIYNSAFDTEILLFELDRYYSVPGPEIGPRRNRWDYRHPSAEKIYNRLAKTAECAMTWNAQYVGDWSDYWGDYRWWPLDGGHRAAGDCRAVRELLQEMAADSASQASDVLTGQEASS